MKREWKIIYSSYDGIQKSALDFLNSGIDEYLIRDAGVYTFHTLNYSKEYTSDDKNVVIIGLYDENEYISQYIKKEDIPENGYVVKVTENIKNPEYDAVILTADDEINLFYAVADFIDDYIPKSAVQAGVVRTIENTFEERLKPYFRQTAPKFKVRSVFTWGHPIKDFKKYLFNLARCKINRVIIWNDFMPINGREVTEYAHTLGIEVFWGFAWGWSTDCTDINIEKLEELKWDIVNKYKNDYLGAGDGIYFQSFTELKQDKVGGVLIAEAVTNFVNSVCDELYKITPDIKIQFGLHATSVKDSLEYIEKTDSRVEILWEDCGAFPYDYIVEYDKEGYEKALEFTKKIVALRNYGKTGLAYKGQLTLDWDRFVYQSGPFILGRNSDAVIKNDFELMKPKWKFIQGEWINNGKHVYDFTNEVLKMAEEKPEMCIVGQLTDGIWYSEALCAQILWDCTESFEDIVDKVGKRKCVTFA